ncbi:MAG: hypothetical protein D3918_07840 [Candidatus Electrothrix sp. AX2]|nr:hypothetical protein [Candidatus Electrothrix gigas]
MTRVLTLAADPSFFVRSTTIAATVKKEALNGEEKTVYSKEPKWLKKVEEAQSPRKDVVDGPPEDEPAVDSPVEQVPVEEVLHGIELTPESLVITVATGGRTEKGSFHVQVDRGYKKLPRYLVTVYRIKSDDSKGDFEPIRISFSREELGLEGDVDFRVLNKIGNTSQHRLLP